MWNGYSSKLENQCILRPVSRKKKFKVLPEFPGVITRYPLFSRSTQPFPWLLLPQVSLTSFTAEKAERSGLFRPLRVSPRHTYQEEGLFESLLGVYFSPPPPLRTPRKPISSLWFVFVASNQCLFGNSVFVHDQGIKPGAQPACRLVVGLYGPHQHFDLLCFLAHSQNA